jgi:hypothetical protein
VTEITHVSIRMKKKCFTSFLLLPFFYYVRLAILCSFLGFLKFFATSSASLKIYNHSACISHLLKAMTPEFIQQKIDGFHDSSFLLTTYEEKFSSISVAVPQIMVKKKVHSHATNQKHKNRKLIRMDVIRLIG